MRILIIDDEKSIRENLAEICLDEAHEADCAPNGRDALELFQQNHYDLAFIDYNLEGEMDGFELIKEFRKINQSIPLYLMSANRQVLTFDDPVITGIIDKCQTAQIYFTMVEIIKKHETNQNP